MSTRRAASAASRIGPRAPAGLARITVRSQAASSGHQAAVADRLARAVVAVDEDDGVFQPAQATERLQKTLQEQ